MNRFTSLFTLMAALVLWSGISWAAPVVPAPTSNPAFLTQGTGIRPVALSTLIQDPNFIPGSAYLQRLNATGQWTNLGLMSPGPGTGVLTFTTNENTANFARIRYRVSAGFKTQASRVASPALEIVIGVLVPTGAAQTIRDSSGLQFSIPAGATTVPLVVGIASAPPSTLGPPVGDLLPVKVVDLIIQPSTSAPTTTLLARETGSLSFMANATTITNPSALTAVLNGNAIYVADKVLADYVNPADPDITKQFGLVAIGTATCTLPCITNSLVSATSTNLGGYFGANKMYAFYAEGTTGTGFVKGSVTLNNDINPDTGGSQSVSRPGVYIKNSTNSFLFYTDAVGNYKVPLSTPTPTSTLTAFDLSRCLGVTVNVTDFSDKNLVLTGSTVPPLTRPGVRNGGFEANSDLGAGGASPYCWTKGAGDTNLMVGPSRGGAFNDFLGLGTTIQPSEGNWMAALRSPGSFVEQQFIVPAGVTELFYDFTFGCPTPCTTLPASRLNDTLEVRANGTIQNTHALKDFGGQLGWRTGKITVTPNSTITFRLTALDPNGDGFPSTILVDNVRFRTVFLDVKILRGVGGATNSARVIKNVRDANEFLSQAGTSVQIRKDTTGNFKITNPPPDDPGGLAAVDLGTNAIDATTGLLVRTTGVKTVLCLSRGALTDVNVYYTASLSLSGNAVFGVSITPDDYEMTSGNNQCGTTDPLSQRGILISDTSIADLDREVLAHELGHLLMSPDQAGGPTEHAIEWAPASATGQTGYKDSANIMQQNRCTSGNPPCSARTLMRGNPSMGNVGTGPAVVSQSQDVKIATPSQQPSCPVTCPQ